MAQRHGRQPLSGRDPHEAHRVSTPLELLYDLTYAVAFGVAADALADHLVEGHYAAGIGGFLFAAFGVSWAWISYSWFASAYDTDDWVCRLCTMAQMVGVLVLALGMPEVFASIDQGGTFDNRAAVTGYVIMRVPSIYQWLRAARHDPARRSTALLYVKTLVLSQIGWVALVLLDTSVRTFFTLLPLVLALEISGPLLAERKGGSTPWHAHHIAERYGLLVIITLGEGIIGTVASLNAVVHGPEGWSTDAVLVAIAGVGLTFGLWWSYFVIPNGELLHAHRERYAAWGYGHVLVFGSLAAMGAGLHVAAFHIEGESHLGATATILTIAVPVAVYGAVTTSLYTLLTRTIDRFHVLLAAATAAVMVAAIAMAASGVAMSVCLVVLSLAPLVTVIGYETVGHRHVADTIERIEAEASTT